ncbi:predicted protein [Plenodomus lingam JN3]|uniref:Predicted protein n=1 Tax=Leptosphaeria maculans (strain JN3 / isolate v23.1.3 / race Av1-4-5-6-7-8) TaxID=985895 RepID=E4ZWX0_LEPMJ|nr:predicted protein [Plenodomus lingam JN3]CBX96096.1 predicted protein [Plenodomus lingam JN3]
MCTFPMSPRRRVAPSVTGWASFVPGWLLPVSTIDVPISTLTRSRIPVTVHESAAGRHLRHVSSLALLMINGEPPCVIIGTLCDWLPYPAARHQCQTCQRRQLDSSSRPPLLCEAGPLWSNELKPGLALVLALALGPQCWMLLNPLPRPPAGSPSHRSARGTNPYLALIAVLAFSLAILIIRVISLWDAVLDGSYALFTLGRPRQFALAMQEQQSTLDKGHSSLMSQRREQSVLLPHARFRHSATDHDWQRLAMSSQITTFQNDFPPPASAPHSAFVQLYRDNCIRVTLSTRFRQVHHHAAWQPSLTRHFYIDATPLLNCPVKSCRRSRKLGARQACQRCATPQRFGDELMAEL